MEPFLSPLAAESERTHELRIVHGKGRFGRQIASGAEAYARQLGFTRISMGPADVILANDLPEDWTLITAGTFEEDIETVMRARCLARTPRVTCAVAAGVREFSHAIERPDGTFGIAQWFQGSATWLCWALTSATLRMRMLIPPFSTCRRHLARRVQLLEQPLLRRGILLVAELAASPARRCRTPVSVRPARLHR
jgi:hypothetical protein